MMAILLINNKSLFLDPLRPSKGILQKSMQIIGIKRGVRVPSLFMNREPRDRVVSS